MGRRRKIMARQADEETVKRIAYVMGEMSAAQQAMDKAAEYLLRGMTVKYWFTDDNFIVVEGIAPEEMREEATTPPTASEGRG